METALSDAIARCIQAGPIGIAGLGMAEKLFPFVPSYAAFVALGIAIAAQQSDLATAIPALAFGSTLGSLGWYAIGLALGKQRSEIFVKRFGRYMGLTPSLYLRATTAFQRHLFLIIAGSQTIPVVRVYIAIPAGVLSVSLMQFLPGTFVGSLAWSGLLLALGFWIGDTSANPAVAGGAAVTALIALESVILYGCRRFRRRQTQRCPPDSILPSQAVSQPVPPATSSPSQPAQRSSSVDRNLAAQRPPT